MKATAARTGIGLPGVLTIVFVVLKLTDLVDWSWWWALSPLWISLGFWLAVAFIALTAVVLCAFFSAIFSAIAESRRGRR